MHRRTLPFPDPVCRTPSFPTFGNYYVYALGDTGSVFARVSSGDFGAQSGPAAASLANAATVGGFIYFPGIAGSSTSGPGRVGSGRVGNELYRTDGTNPPTLVKNIAAEVGGTVNSGAPIVFTATSNHVYFVADDGFHGRELWVTDGTETGTHLVRDHATGIAQGTVKDITPGAVGITTTQVFAFGSGLGFFRGADVYGSDGTDAGTNVLATADGTAAGTFALTAGAFDGTAGGHPDVGPVTPLGSKLIFTERFPGDTTFSQRRVYVIDTTQPDGPRLSAPVTGPPPVVTTPKKSLSLGRKAKLRGSAWIGQRIRLTLPKFRQKKVKLSFRWYANRKAIKKQTQSFLKLTKRLKGKRITLKITARKSGYKTRTFTLKVKGTVR